MIQRLKLGVEGVQEALMRTDLQRIGYHRLASLLKASQRITWAYELDGGIYAVDEDAPVTSVQVAVLCGEVPARLNRHATFQVQQDDDAITRVYVRPRPYTPTWAGILLFHELDHVVDHLDGTWPATPSADDWWSAEARAYHREALVIDAITNGGLLPVLLEIASNQTVDRLTSEDPLDLGQRLYSQTFPAELQQPPASEKELYARAAAFAMAAVVAIDAHPVSLADLAISGAGENLHVAAQAWGWGA